MYCESVKVVCKYYGSVVDMHGVLKSCGSVVVVCEYNGSLVGVYGLVGYHAHFEIVGIFRVRVRVRVRDRVRARLIRS